MNENYVHLYKPQKTLIQTRLKRAKNIFAMYLALAMG